MTSNYLKNLSDQMGQYQAVLIYGAGGVAKNLLIFLEPYIHKDRAVVVVSQKKENEDQMAGYPVRQIDQFVQVRDQALVILATMPRLALEMEAHARKLGFQTFITAEEIADQVYQEIWQDQIHNNKIVFSSFAGGGFGGNGKYIALELLECCRDLDLVWVVKDQGMEVPNTIRKVAYGTYDHYWEQGTARIWIDNQHKNYFTRKRQGQFYIQTWHGGGPLKKIEFDGENLSRSYLDLCEMNSRLEDLMISPTRFNSGLYRTAFHYDGEIMECGYPRNDIFWNDGGVRGRIEKLFGVNQGEMIALYAPTFRIFEKREEDILDLKKVREAMEGRFGKKCRIFVRLHPCAKEAADSYPGIRECTDVTSYGDAQELFAAADVLITDYSSVMWDFSLTGKPVFLFHPDVDLYEKERGYYLPFKEMPYVESFGNEDLCEKIAAFHSEGYCQRTKAFVETYGSFDRGTAAKAVGDRILKILGREMCLKIQRNEGI
jgi:CDP-glycerol glycerophosphotransferase